jgi:hypothetical protein
LRRSRLSRRRHSPAERVDDMRRGVDSSETNAEQATPKSTPHPGNPLATAGRSRVATPKLTCQPRASRDTVALRSAALLELRRSGGVLWAPPVVIGGIEISQHLLRRLGRQVGQPGQLGAGLGQLAVLPDCPEGLAALGPCELSLRQRDVPYRPGRMPPIG